MKSLTKILTIGLITLASLTGCMKKYEFDGSQIKYNKNIATSMIINEGDSIVKYYTPFRGSEGPTGKDVIMTATYYKDGSRNISDNTSPDFKVKTLRYDYYLTKIDSMNNLK